MSGTGWAIIFALGATAAVAVVLVVVIWQAFRTWQTKLTARAAGTGHVSAGEVSGEAPPRSGEERRPVVLAAAGGDAEGNL